MVEAWIAVLLSVGAVSLISLVGAVTFTIAWLGRHGALLALVAFAAGTLLGDAFLHLLPEAVEQAGGLGPRLAAWVLGGFFTFFLLEVGFRWGHAHGEGAHTHTGGTDEPPTPARVAPFAWTNLVGDGVHNFVDGTLIAASYLVDAKLGIATTVAVAAHEIPQELGDFAVLIKAGLRARTALLYNLLSALLAFLGALVVLAVGLPTDTLTSYAVPLIAGGFIYIAAADLVPELHHHTGTRYVPVILTGLLGGLAAMGGLLYLEGG